jgi:hypothetical protein
MMIYARSYFLVTECSAGCNRRKNSGVRRHRKGRTKCPPYLEQLVGEPRDASGGWTFLDSSFPI